MNLFVIDSLTELREDMLGSTEAKSKMKRSLPLIRTDDTGKETGAFTAEFAEVAKENEGRVGQSHAKLGWGGMTREGVGSPESPTSRVIADIACHRRERKGKTLPLIRTDDTDKETGAFTAKVAEVAKENEGRMGQSHAKLGCGGMHRRGGG